MHLVLRDFVVVLFCGLSSETRSGMLFDSHDHICFLPGHIEVFYFLIVSSDYWLQSFQIFPKEVSYTFD